MSEFDVIKRIQELCRAYSWTYYRLAKESGITYSTLSTMLNKRTLPSIPTLEKICRGFNISLGQFFSEDETAAKLTQSQKEHLTRWAMLTSENQTSADMYVNFLLAQQDETRTK